MCHTGYGEDRRGRMIILRLLTLTSNVLVYCIEFKYGMRSNHNVLLIYLFISWGKKRCMIILCYSITHFAMIQAVKVS